MSKHYKPPQYYLRAFQHYEHDGGRHCGLVDLYVTKQRN
jgi:hypothetical protein